MIANLIGTLVLAAKMLVVFPDAPPAQVIVTAYAATVASAGGIPAPLLAAIAEHESKLYPNTVTYTRDGERVDLVWDGRAALPPFVFCGYLSAMSSPELCRAMIADDGGMAAGASELVLWMGTCRGDVRCALRGHAGGTACAMRKDCTPHAAAFARLFYRRAVRLGMGT